MKTPREKPGQRCRALRNGFPGRTGKNHDNSRGNMPHMCGEDWMTSPSAGAVAETPPRAWGKPKGDTLKPVLRGNTPTGVGKTFLTHKNDLTKKKHPHGRGENTGR